MKEQDLKINRSYKLRGSTNGSHSLFTEFHHRSDLLTKVIWRLIQAFEQGESMQPKWTI